MSKSSSPLSLSRSVVAVFGGFATWIVLTVVTDMILQAFQIFPMPDVPAGDRILFLAFLYRSVYAFVASYITASLASHRPVAHALVCGLCGFAVALENLIETWSPGATFRPHWYAIALVMIALPESWLAGWLRRRQIE